MSFNVGSSFFPACISSQTIHKIHLSDAPPSLSLWEKIKDFFFNNHHDQAMDCLYKLCHPEPGISRQEVEDLFYQLKELAAPGYKNNFIADVNTSFDNCFYRITRLCPLIA
jgi:Sif protein